MAVNAALDVAAANAAQNAVLLQIAKRAWGAAHWQNNNA